MALPKNHDETAVNELTLAIGSLVRRMRSESPSSSSLHELSWTQKSVIARLEREGPTTTAELARAEGVKPQSMGTALALLEEMGLIERKAHPTDGRQMNIKLTAKGSTMRKISRDASRTWLTQAIEKLSKQDQATLFAAGEIIKRLVEVEA
jgi:DNA-binding MarR family transcriptional regulator